MAIAAVLLVIPILVCASAVITPAEAHAQVSEILAEAIADWLGSDASS